MNLSQAFTEHYLSIEPEDENFEYDFQSSKSEDAPMPQKERSNILIFPVMRSESWRQVRMDAQ